MTRRGRPIRISALIAAYALVLHAMLAGMAPMAHPTGVASLANAIICAGTAGADQPAGRDHDDRGPCVQQCLMAGSAMHGWTPAVSGIVAIFAPADIRVSVLQPIATLGRATAKNPQIPRAPPLA